MATAFTTAVSATPAKMAGTSTCRCLLGGRIHLDSARNTLSAPRQPARKHKCECDQTIGPLIAEGISLAGQPDKRD